MVDIDDLYDDVAEQEALGLLVERRYRSTLRAVHHLVADLLGLDAVEAFRLRDVDTEAVLARAAERVVRIDATTKAQIQEMLQRGQALGLSNWEIANGSPKNGFPGVDSLLQERWAGRASVIAREEIANAQHISSLDRYRASGIVQSLIAHDGDHDEPCAHQNGRTFAIDNPPIRQHIQCTLVMVPVVSEPAP